MALAVVAIIAALAAPSLQTFANEQRLASTLELLQNDLRFARSEAIKRNTRVLLCARNAAGTGCGGGGDWQNGWLVCYDANRDDVCDASVADDPNPIRLAALGARLALTAEDAVARFNAIGSSSAPVRFTLSGTWSEAGARVADLALSGSVTTRRY